MGKVQYDKIIAQTCSSRECNAEFASEKTKQSQAVTTPHGLNRKTKQLICLYCGKKTKITTL
jgi:hypothetical protein